MAQETLGKVAGGDDPAAERAQARGIPTLADAFEEFMDANPDRAESTAKGYREFVECHLGDWLGRPLDNITRRDVEARFNRVTREGGWATANRTISLLRSASGACNRPAASGMTCTRRLAGARSPAPWASSSRSDAHTGRSLARLALLPAMALCLLAAAPATAQTNLETTVWSAELTVEHFFAQTRHKAGHAGRLR